jgi:type II secretory pathway pseudopilin PulG
LPTRPEKNVHPGGGGFTAFETLIAVAILAILTAAVSGALSAGRQQSRAANELLQARMLGEALMDEILRLPPSGNINKTAATPGVTRQTAVDLQDYQNYTDGPQNVQDLNGVAYPSGMQGFIRKVTVTRLGTMALNKMPLPSPCVVTISVTLDGREVLSQSRLVPG